MMPTIDPGDLTSRFIAEMARIGPFQPCPRLAVAVSGGADSMALAMLANQWAVREGGAVLALTVDHGLRTGSSTEADLTLRRVAAAGIPGRKLIVTGLARGPALAERAREARYRLLLDACATAGIAHLMLGHHVGDQVETVMMRALSGSASRGLAGMPALLETSHVRLLRPLLNVAPGRLRAYLVELGIPWIEDPSNGDRAALRSRLRVARADPNGTSEGTWAVARAARAAGERRAERDRAIAETLAGRATIGPEGYALLTPGAIEPEALAALLRTIAGASYASPIDRVASLARALQPATLGGVRIVPAGRLGAGWLLVREPRAISGPVPGRLNVVWDGRFRLAGIPPAPDGCPDGLTANGITIGALGADSRRFRKRDGPPALVLHGLPALRSVETLVGVPQIGVGDPLWHLLFHPRNPAAGAPFSPGA
jgi:tRNA(Ile)-lysidine synthase